MISKEKIENCIIFLLTCPLLFLAYIIRIATQDTESLYGDAQYRKRGK